MTQNILGISGLTTGALGIWVGVIGAILGIFGRIIIKWVSGMADRKRADNEAVPLMSAASEVLMKRMVAEVERLSTRVEKLEARVDELEDSERRLIGERDAALAKVARLEAVNTGQGEVRQQVAAIVAADRLEVASLKGARQ